MRRLVRTLMRLVSVFQRPITLFRVLYRDSRTPLVSKVLPIVALAYLLFPIDLIPDFFVGLGILDDVTVITLLLSAAIRRLPQDVREELESPHKM